MYLYAVVLCAAEREIAGAETCWSLLSAGDRSLVNREKGPPKLTRLTNAAPF